MKSALITGITGQDGSYLAEFLLSKGYTVHGIIRRASSINTSRIDHIYEDPHEPNPHLFLHYGDLSDSNIITELIFNIKPDEIYNLAAQSHVRVSFDIPEYTGNVTGLGTIRLLEALRRSKIDAKYYQASSSELFGCSVPPQNELTTFIPQSPYAIAKIYSYWMTVNYRHAYNLFACNGILFNHESPRRGETFVTRKITKGLSKILAGKQKKLFLGNLNARRDWGFAPDYVEMMHLMLQQDSPDDYVIGTGESHSIKEFVEEALSYCGISIEWAGKDFETKGIISENNFIINNTLKPGAEIIAIDERYYRPTEVDYLLADPSKAKEKLNWEPRIFFNELVRIMMDADIKFVGLVPRGEGEKILKEKEFHWFNNK